jgi:transposase
MANDTVFPVELDLPNVKIVEVKINSDGHYEIVVESTQKGCHCYKCGNFITKPHGCDREIRLKHLSILGRDTYIIIRLPRYQCMVCSKKPTTTQQVPWFIRRSPFTIAYELYVLSLLIGSNVQEVSQQEGIGYAAVLGIIDRHVKKEVDWDKIDSLAQLGLDEISLKKGHKDFVTIVSTRVNGEVQILAILKDRKKETVKAFLNQIPEKLVKTIRSVCSDLYDGFINAAKEVFGKRVRIVADRFHVAKLYRDCLDSLRKQELKRLRQDLSKEEYAQLKGVMWVLRKNTNDLSKENKELLDKLFDYSPDLKSAYHFQNDLTAIFNMDIPRAKGKRKIKSWMRKVSKSGLKCYNKFLSTLDSYMTEIVNYFVHRDSSGFVEGLNNKIKVIKRRCYGIFNVDHLFQRVFLDLSGRKVLPL